MPSWGTLVKRAFQAHEEHCMLGVVLVFAFCLVCALGYVDIKGKDARCIEALRTPNVNPAVLMQVCR